MTAPENRSPNRFLQGFAAFVLLISLMVTIVLVAPSADPSLDGTARDTNAPSAEGENDGGAAETFSPLQKLQQLSAIPDRPKINEDDVGTAYLDAYMLAEEAKKLEENGNIDSALAKFQEAQRGLDRIRYHLPDWRSEVVSYRCRKIVDAIERIERGEPATGSGSNTGQGSGAVDGVSDIYLKAYMLADEAGELEANGDKQAALEHYEDAAIILDQIRRMSPGWRPEIVTYRTRKVTESIARVAAR